MQRLHSSEGRTASEPLPPASQTIILNTHEETLATLQSKPPGGRGLPPQTPGKEPLLLPSLLAFSPGGRRWESGACPGLGHRLSWGGPAGILTSSSLPQQPCSPAQRGSSRPWSRNT